MNKFNLFFYNIILTFCLIFPANIFANVPISNGETKEIANWYTKNNQSLEAQLSALTKEFPAKAAELKEYVNKEGINLNQKLPSLTVKDNAISFELNKEKVIVTFYKNKLIDVSVNGKSIQLSSETSIDKIGNEIKTLLKNPNYSYLNLFIDNANAEPMVTFAMIGVVLGILGVLYGSFIGLNQVEARELKKIEDYAVQSYEECQRVDVSAGIPQEFKPILAARLNTMTDQYLSNCSGNKKPDLCEYIKQVKSCYKEKIKTAESAKNTTNSARITDKKLILNEKTDKYELKLIPTSSK